MNKAAMRSQEIVTGEPGRQTILKRLEKEENEKDRFAARSKKEKMPHYTRKKDFTRSENGGGIDGCKREVVRSTDMAELLKNKN